MYLNQPNQTNKIIVNQQDDTLLDIFRWLSFALAIILTLLSILSKSFLSFFIFLLIAVVLFAPAGNYLKRKIPFLKSRILKGISVSTLFVVAFLSLKISLPNRPYIKKEKPVLDKEIQVSEVLTDTVLIEKPIASEDIVQERMDGDNSSFWNDYDIAVKKKIYKLIVEKDCRSLQLQFDIADNNNDLQLRRTGKTNSDLLYFIDEAMRGLDCY